MESVDVFRARLQEEMSKEKLTYKEFLRKRMPTTPQKADYAAFKRFLDGQNTFPARLTLNHFKSEEGGDDAEEEDDQHGVDKEEDDDVKLIRAFQEMRVDNVHFVYVYFDIRYFKRQMTLELFVQGLFYIGQGQDERHTHTPRSNIDPVVDIREAKMEARKNRYWRVERVFIMLPPQVANEIEASLITALQNSGKHFYDSLSCMRHWNKKCMCNSRSGRRGKDLTRIQQAKYSNGEQLLEKVYDFFTTNLFDHLPIR